MSAHPPVRVGLIGAEGIARAHAIAYVSAGTYGGPAVPPVRLVRVADVDGAVAKEAAARLGFDVDLVSIVTPNFLHAPMAVAAAAAGVVAR
jgi:predicted dehydrogenase